MTVPCYQPIRDQYFYREGFTLVLSGLIDKLRIRRNAIGDLLSNCSLQFMVNRTRREKRDKQCTLTLTAAIKTDRSSEVIALKQR